jgi:hypothetical protein
MGLGLVNCGDHEHDPSAPYLPPYCPRHHECSSVGYTCDESTSVSCFVSSDGCNHRAVNIDCAEIGAACVDGVCVFDETCGDDVGSFCRNGYVLHCPLEDDWFFHRCPDDRPCRETVGADGLTHAVCATDDVPCRENSAAQVECRGDEVFTCSYGLVEYRSTCRGCVLNPPGEALPVSCL